MTKVFRAALPLLAALIVPACGGSGGGQDPSPASGSPEVAFVADATQTGVDELFAADLEGAHRIPLSGPLVAGGNVTQFSWSPDGTRVAFLADKDTDETFELYVVAAAGGTPVKVSGTLVAGRDVRSFGWSPDGSRIAYIANQDTDGKFELYTSLSSGAGNVKVSGTLPPSASVEYFVWSPDGTRIAYKAGGATVFSELHTCSPAGGGDFRVSGPPVMAGLPLRFSWAPDGSRLAYENYQDGFSGAELYTVLPDGSSNVRVSGGAGENADAFLGPWSPDGSRLSFQLKVGGGSYVLQTVHPNGTGTASFGVGGLQAWAPDGSRLAYVADNDHDGSADLVTALPDGTGVVTVSGPMVTDGDVGWYNGNGLVFAWSPDGSRIAYYADQVTNNVVELFTAPAAGGGNIKVSAPLPAGGLVSGAFRWSPDGVRLAYRLDTTESVLYTAKGDLASSGMPVSAPPASGAVDMFFWSRTGSRLLYTNNGTLYSCLPAGGGIATLGGPRVKTLAARP